MLGTDWVLQLVLQPADQNDLVNLNLNPMVLPEMVTVEKEPQTGSHIQPEGSMEVCPMEASSLRSGAAGCHHIYNFLLPKHSVNVLLSKLVVLKYAQFRHILWIMWER